MPVEKLHTRTLEISLEKKGYVKIKILPDVLIDEEDALDNLLVLKNLTKKGKYLKLVDIRGNWKMSKRAREISNKNLSSENTLARAYIIDSFLTKLLLNFFKSYKSNDVPQEFFTDEAEAVKWLLSQQTK